MGAVIDQIAGLPVVTDTRIHLIGDIGDSQASPGHRAWVGSGQFGHYACLCAHAHYHEALRARWDEGDFERYIPYLVFPVDVTRDVVDAFNRLKARQAGLLEQRRILRRHKIPTITHADYTAELQDYIKRYERDAQLEEAADTHSPAGSGTGEQPTGIPQS